MEKLKTTIYTALGKKKSVLWILLLFPFVINQCRFQTLKEDSSSSSIVATDSEDIVLPQKEIITYEEARDFLKNLMEENGIPALSVAVSLNRQTYLFTIGSLSSQSSKQVNNNTVFQAGPLGQPVFASLVMKLWLEGKINIDEPVEKYLKKPLYEYLGYENLKGDSRIKRLTARRLLSHQSGFPFSRYMSPTGKLYFKSTPGKEFCYSIEGYQLLQLVIEELTGVTVNELAKDKIFDFLGMRHSSFIWEPRFEGNHALVQRGNMSTVSVGEFFLTTASDYMKFLNSRPWGGWPEVKISSKNIYSSSCTEDRVPRPKRLSWALGWGYYLYHGQHVNFHGSQSEAYENYASAFYSRRIPSFIIILCSKSNGNTITAQILEKFIGDTSAPLHWLNFTSSNTH